MLVIEYRIETCLIVTVEANCSEKYEICQQKRYYHLNSHC